ncbi:MAG TPA: cyanophycinase [Clostridia bacterium]|nr:cyanophycinase [Clostridia bacterium]
MAILRRIVELAGGTDGNIAVVATASGAPLDPALRYRSLFLDLGIGQASCLPISSRIQAYDPGVVERIRKSTGVFFTGGDQLRITSILGGTPVHKALLERRMEGALVAGTSAGASAMSDIMIVGGPEEEAPKKCTTKLAPGMGLLHDSVIDQHFAQRGRIGRLLSAIAQNPGITGIGIDEDTAIEVGPDLCFTVLGSQTVTVIDGRNIEITNASERAPDSPLALTDVTLHILPKGYGYDLKTGKPLAPKGD